MEIREFLTETSKGIIPLATLTTIAADRRAFGDDVITAFKTQIEQRSHAAQKVLGDAETAGRDTLLASEQRSYDAAVRERDSLLALQQAIERRTEQRAHVPATQTHGTPERRAGLFGVELRALVENTGAGGVIVPDDFQASFFDALVAQSVGLRAGFRVVRTNRDVMKVPRVDSDPAAAWTSEAGTITAADPGYTELSATPRKLATLTVMSNELIADSNPSVIGLLEMQVARALALKLDLGFFEGSGTAPEIRGLKNVTGISTVSMGTNGAAFTNLDQFADAIGQLEQDNARATAIVLHPRSWKALIKLKEATSGNNKPLLQDSAGSGSQGVTRSIYGVPVFLSSQLSVAETQGTATNASSAYVVQADQCVTVFREDVRVELDRSRLFNSDQSELRAILRADLVVPNAKAIVRILGIIP